MNWRNRVAVLLSAASPFAFGEGHALAAASQPATFDGNVTLDRDAWVYRDPADQHRLLQLAGHSSHSSHASHASHSSHYSGSGGSYSPPRAVAPVYIPPAPKAKAPARAAATKPSTAPSTPSFTTVNPLISTPVPDTTQSRLSQDETREFVRKTQIALIMKGFDPGPADGQLSPKTQEALKAYHTSIGFKATGFLEVETLRRLGVIN